MKKILSLKKTPGSQKGYFGYDSVKTYHPTSPLVACVKLVLEKIYADWWVAFHKYEDFVFIYDRESFKEMLDLNVMSEQEAKAYEQAYDQYYDKRWDDMPHAKIKMEDWKRLEKKWNLLYKQWPKYAVFYLNDSQEFTEVDLVFKDDLSEEDVALMKENYEHLVKYDKAYEKYKKNHPDYSEIWRGPQDDEYEADIMKYYDKDE